MQQQDKEVTISILQGTVQSLRNTVGDLHVSLAESNAKINMFTEQLNLAHQEIARLKNQQAPEVGEYEIVPPEKHKLSEV